jgi:hypothetical protein
MLPKMPAPVVLAWKALAPGPRILAAREAAEIEPRSLVHVVDVPVDIFRGFEAPTAMRALFGVCVRFKVPAETGVSFGRAKG